MSTADGEVFGDILHDSSCFVSFFHPEIPLGTLKCPRLLSLQHKREGFLLMTSKISLLENRTSNIIAYAYG